MARLFEASTPVEKAIVKGDSDGLIKLLRAMKPEERARQRTSVARINGLIEGARYVYKDDTFKGWGRSPSDEQMRAGSIAAFLCGTARDVANTWFEIDDLLELGREFSPPSLPDLNTELMKAAAWQSHIHAVQSLIVAGLSPRPECDEYALGLMLLFSHVPRHRDDVYEHLAADPGLKDALLRVMEVEGTQDVSLASIDKYSKGQQGWAERLMDLSQRGVYPRALLVDKALAALERGWIQYRSGWFSSFHTLLAPTPAEMRPHAARYLALLGSRIPPTVSFALEAVKQLDDAQALDDQELLRALTPVMSSAIKGQVEAALKLSDRLVKRNSGLGSEVAVLIAPALAHEAAPLQKSVLQRLAVLSIPPALRESMKEYAGGMAAVNRKEFARLVSENGAAPPKAGKPATPRVRSPSAAATPALKKIEAIKDLDELVERVAYVFEHDTDIDELERSLAGLVVAAPLSETARQRFAPVARRIGKLRKVVPGELGRLLHFLLTGERLKSRPGADFCGHPIIAQEQLIERVDELIALAARGKQLMPLATPTHQHGFIDALVLVQRLSAFKAAAVRPGSVDLEMALLRMACNGREEVLAKAGKLGDAALERALARALAPADVAPPRDAVWSIREEKFQSGKMHRHFNLVRLVDAKSDHAAALELRAVKAKPKGWYDAPTVGGNDEASILYYASLRPRDLFNFFAEGAHAIGHNLDWWQAQWYCRAYLQQLLRADARLGATGHLLLALALAGKEPGQTAIAVDALVQARLTGRLEVEDLATTMRDLACKDFVSCARYAKALRAALRIDEEIAEVLVQLLGTLLAARPADPPKDTAAILELLLEIVVANRLVIPQQQRATLDELVLKGRPERLRRQLLAQG